MVVHSTALSAKRNTNYMVLNEVFFADSVFMRKTHFISATCNNSMKENAQN